MKTIPTLYAWLTADQAAAVREYGTIPADGPLGLVWMTTAPASTVTGDLFSRGDVRAVVDDPRAVEHWLEAQKRWQLHEYADLELVPGAMPGYWFVASVPVAATIG